MGAFGLESSHCSLTHLTEDAFSTDSLLSGVRATTLSMERVIPVLLWVAGMAVAIVAVDILFFRHLLWPRLAANIGIVLLAAAFYFRFHGRL